MKKVYICGLVASAKGLLRSLLDGHHDIVNYDFDIGVSLLKDEFTKYCSRPKPVYEQKMYNNTAISKVSIFVRIEGNPKVITVGELFVYLLSIDRKYRDIFDVTLSGEKLVTQTDSQILSKEFQFDVFGFLKSFADKVVSVKNFDSIEHLQDTLYQCVIDNSETLKSNYSDKSLFLQSSYNGYGIIEKILQRNKDRKIVAVVRDPIALCFTNYKITTGKYGKRKYPVMFGFNYFYNKYNPVLFSKGFINRVRNYNERVLKLSETEKDVYVVKTEDIICNTKNALNGIADFLGIEKQDILYKPTFDGMPTRSGTMHSTGEIIDDPYKVLASDQIRMLKYLFYGWNQNEAFNDKVGTVYNLSILKVMNSNLFQRSFVALRDKMRMVRS